MFFKRAFSVSATAAQKVLLVVEHDGKNIAHSSLSAITAARSLGKDVTALVAGQNTKAVAEQVSKFGGISKVLHTEDEGYSHGMAENYASLLAAVQKSQNFSHVVAPSSAFGKNVIPRFGAMLDVQPIPDVVAIKDEKTFVRPLIAGNALATVESTDALKVITVRQTAFAKAEADGGSASIEAFPAAAKHPRAEWVSDELIKSDRPALESATRVVSGGRALASKEAFDEVIFGLADVMGAGVGASRAACDAGYVSNDHQVGQTGKTVAPQLYMAFGISGAIQHVAGMKDSKVIVVVNKDPEAPFFQLADFGLVADLFPTIEEMKTKLKK